MSEDQKPYRVAVVVFVETDAVDEWDAEHRAEAAIRQAIRKAGTPTDRAYTLTWNHRDGREFTARVRSIMELGRCLSFRALTIHPSELAFTDD